METSKTDQFSYSLLRPDEVSRILSISKSKVYRMIKTGELPSVLVGYSKRVHPEDLQQYIEGCRNPVESDVY